MVTFIVAGYLGSLFFLAFIFVAKTHYNNHPLNNDIISLFVFNRNL